MMTLHWKNLRRLGLGTAALSIVVLLTFGMVIDRYEMHLLVVGTTLVAGLTTFCATFVYGPLSYPRASSEAILARALLVFLSVGLVVVGSAAVRGMLA
jgi:hypothetical protein